MALRLSDWVVCGEIDNTRRNAVHGWLGLRDRDTPVPLHLTGNCAPDLAGRRLRFKARAPVGLDEAFDGNLDLSVLAAQQIGPTGEMTAIRQVRVLDSAAHDRTRRPAAHEPAPNEWKTCLYLEWFSQNGRMVVELVEPEIEFIDPPRSDEALEQPPSPSGAYLELFRGYGDDEPPLDDDLEAMLLDEEEAGFEQEDEEDDPYGLFPAALHQHFDREAERADEVVFDDDPRDHPPSDLDLIDTLIESGLDVPVGSLFDPPMRLPSVEQVAALPDAEAEQVLRSLLARLALYGIALDVCEHYTPQEAYRLLVERICPEEGVFPELGQTQWVQHFMTHEFCDRCTAELEPPDE